MFAGADWDSVPPPPQPLPWSHVERIERRTIGFTPMAVVRAAGGAVLGAGAGLFLFALSSDSEELLGGGSGTIAPLAVRGAAGGAYVIGRDEKWEPAWP
jgi:hypothetical protein